jgi:hypothetical protein
VQGPLHGDNAADRALKGLESKVVAVVHPRNSHRGRYSLPQAVLDMDNLRTGNIKDLVEDVFDRFASTAAQLPQVRRMLGSFTEGGGWFLLRACPFLSPLSVCENVRILFHPRRGV